MQLKLKPKASSVTPSHFKVSPSIIVSAIHNSVEDAVIHSVERNEKITLSIKFSLDNPEIFIRRTSYAGKAIDLRTSSVSNRLSDIGAIPDTIRRNTIRTLNLVAQALLDDIGAFNAKTSSEVTIVVSRGKAIEIKISKSHLFIDRNG
jgi:hypothetical protein